MSSFSFDHAAAVYDRMIGRWSRLWTPALIQSARVRAGWRVLDVAAGTGEGALAAAAVVGEGGSVVASDLSLPMLKVARARASHTGVAIAVMDGQALACRDSTFDAVVCMLGLMFFQDPLKGLREFRRVLRPRGRVAVCVWGTLERSPFPGIMLDVLGRHLPAEKKMLDAGLALGDPALLERLLEEAGFDHADVRHERRRIGFADFEDFWGPIDAGGSRASQAYLTLPADARAAVKAEARERMAAFEDAAGRFVLDVDALFGSGRSG
jgi:ubiquinone/menaquinone biosynthesis C-methylase UbiE